MYRALAAGVLAVLGFAGSAQAASKPAATTGGVAALTFQSARLIGTVNPHGAATTIYFQYGTTTRYGTNTPAVPVGAGTTNRRVTADIAGLIPNKKYHYRLVAENPLGVVSGGDRTFTTKKQPLGLSLAATPNPVPFGGTTTLGGTLSGTGSANRAVVLQGNPFPYTQGFQAVGNPQLTNAQGAFAFPLLSVPLNTQYRVVVSNNAAVASPIVNVGVAVIVSTHLRTRHRGGKLYARFSGTVRPARDGAQVAFQRKHGSTWVTVNGTITHHASTSRSSYRKTIRIKRGGTYRVLVGIVDGNFVSNAGRDVHLKVHG
jgi:hypothetical protein